MLKELSPLCTFSSPLHPFWSEVVKLFGDNDKSPV